MRQAIEEGFILDVLQNYMTYKQYYKLEKAIEDDPELQGRKAQRRVARFATLHPTAIAQKVEVIVEHFRRHVAKELNGEGKAMVVTQNREHALKYYFGIKKYIEEKNYTGVKALVAFSGELDLDGEIYTESGVNGFAETELPEKFDTPAYHGASISFFAVCDNLSGALAAHNNRCVSSSNFMLHQQIIVRFQRYPLHQNHLGSYIVQP
jgi:type I restriction enzyme R subunit